MEYAIRSKALTRRFGKRVVVEDLDLGIREGDITAFLGPNGAGKTTTIRLLLGLLKAHSGTCEVLGHPPGHPKALAQLGALVETPSLYDHLSGQENVEITRLMRNAPRSETDRVLAHVGLSGDARRLVKGYSLGMRQRLGLALALMGNPRLLILDEPTNGLDPAGIQEIREIIHLIPKELGATVFLSSHLLAEVEQVAGQVVVIHRGRLKYQGPMEELGVSGKPQLLVRVDDPDRAARHLNTLGIPSEPFGEHLWIHVAQEEAPRIASGLVGAGVALYELLPKRENLESRFLALVEGE